MTTYALSLARSGSTLQIPLNANNRVEFWDGAQTVELANQPDEDPPDGMLPLWIGGQVVLVPFTLATLSLETIGNLVRNKFYVDVELAKSVLTQYDNGPQVDPDPTGGPWADISVSFSTGIAVDQGQVRTEGILLVKLRDRIGVGEGDLLECADDVDDAFRYQIEPPIRYGPPTLRTAGQEQDRTGTAWWTLAVTVPFAVDRPVLRLTQ